MEQLYSKLLKEIGEDLNRDGLKDTPTRAAKAMRYLTQGYTQNLDEIINDALNLGLKATVSTKYWMEQMGMPFHPTHINKGNQKDRRHGYADLLHYPQRYRIRWQLWSGGTTRLLLWGDPLTAAAYSRAFNFCGSEGVEICEPLSFKG